MFPLTSALNCAFCAKILNNDAIPKALLLSIYWILLKLFVSLKIETGAILMLLSFFCVVEAYITILFGCNILSSIIPKAIIASPAVTDPIIHCLPDLYILKCLNLLISIVFHPSSLANSH